MPIKNSRFAGVGMMRDTRKDNTARRQEINGVMFQACPPPKGYQSAWKSDNGRIKLRQVKPRAPWTLSVDGEDVGNDELTNMAECVRSNDYLIRRAL